MELKFVEVVSASSEDPMHPAESLLRNEKWLSAPGRKHNHIEVVLQLSDTSSIGNIHIGNCGSAYISVLVAKKGSLIFTSLLPQSTFMSVLDCKLSKNKTQVRMFNQSDFLPEAKDDTWSQVKVLCSQPFNMFMQYGVSFVRIFSTSGVCSESKEASPSNWQEFKRLSASPATGNNARNSGTGGLLSRSERLVLQSAKALKSQCNNNFNNNSPQKKASVSPMSEVRASKEENSVEEEDEDVFRAKVVSFLVTLELHKKSLHNIELGRVTKEFEAAAGRQLTLEEKKNFTELLRTHLKSLRKLPAEEQSPSPKCIKSSNSWQCKSPTSQQSSHEGVSKESETTPRKVVVKSCSPGWLTNMIKPSASDSIIEDPAVDRMVTPVKCSGRSRSSSNSFHTAREGLSGGNRFIGVSPRIRRYNLSLEDVEVDIADSPCQSELPSPFREKFKRALASSTYVTENSPKKACDSLDTDDCVFMSSVMRSEDSAGDLHVQCPICSKYFDPSEIQNHAESCESYVETGVGNNTVKCPLCSKKINADEANSHADSCARTMFGD